MAAATDTLGRVMLLDVATLAVICLWKVGMLRASHHKPALTCSYDTVDQFRPGATLPDSVPAKLQGYRDAQCGWLILPKPPGRGNAVTPGADSAGDEAVPSSPAAVRSAKRAKQDVPPEPSETQVWEEHSHCQAAIIGHGSSFHDFHLTQLVHGDLHAIA
jgi:hypothetical protein